MDAIMFGANFVAQNRVFRSFCFARPPSSFYPSASRCIGNYRAARLGAHKGRLVVMPPMALILVGPPPTRGSTCIRPPTAANCWSHKTTTVGRCRLLFRTVHYQGSAKHKWHPIVWSRSLPR